MFPAPTTIASSVPGSCTANTSCAISTTGPGSMPYSRSPRSASPESFRSTRLKGLPSGAATCSGASCGLTLNPGSTRDRDPREPLDRRAGVLERLRHAFRRLVDPRLLEEHPAWRRGEEALREHPVHDLLTRGLR